MIVNIFIRNPFKIGNFSIETFYSELEKELSTSIEVRIKRVPFRNKGLVPRVLNILYCFLNQGDINHVIGDITYCSILMNKKKLIITILDFVSLNYSTGFKNFLLKIFLYKIPIKKARHIIYISDTIKEESLKLFGKNKSQSVIPVTVNNKYYNLKRTNKKFLDRYLLIGTANNKNILRVSNAIKGLDCEISILGLLTNKQRNKLTENNISFKEYFKPLTDDEVIDLYMRSDVLIYASEYEGFGMPIIEANCSGVCVLTSNLSSMPYVAGDSAVFVNPFSEDSIREGLFKIKKSESLRSKLICNGFNNAKRFLIKNIAAEHLKVYLK